MLKRSHFVAHDPADPRVPVAKKLATFYRQLVKSESSFRNPFHPGVPIELQSVFTHFVKAAEVVLQEKADPEMYLRAQFAGLKFANALPFPQQLHTSNARLRYINYAMRKDNSATKKVEDDDYLIDEFEMQSVKLRRLMKATGLFSEKQALRMFGKQFTRAFLRSKGVLK